jgi:hypothetical protein
MQSVMNSFDLLNFEGTVYRGAIVAFAKFEQHGILLLSGSLLGFQASQATSAWG